MAKINECSGEVAYCVMHKIVIALAALTFIFSVIAYFYLSSKKRIPSCGGVAILLWLVSVMNIITFVHYSFVPIQDYPFTLGLREFVRGLIYIWTFLFFGELCRQFTKWPEVIRLVVYISSGIAFAAFLAETISRFVISEKPSDNLLCKESFWLAFRAIQFFIVAFFLVVLIIAQRSFSQTKLENVFDEIEFNKRKDLFWRLWVIVGFQIFVTLFTLIYDIVVRIDTPPTGDCDYPFYTVASNATFYLIFRMISLFCTNWVIIIVLLVRHRDRYPEVGSKGAEYTFKPKSTDQIIPNMYGEVEIMKREVDGSFLVDQTNYRGLLAEMSD